MEPTKTEKVIDKIRALRNIAGSTHSKLEAETAANIAAKLMVEHQLQEAEIVARGQAVAEGIDIEGEHVIYETGRSTPWKAELAWGVAKLNGLFCLKFQIRDAGTHRHGSRYRVFGRKSDIEIGIYMFEYLVSLIQELVDAAHPAGNFVVVNGRMVAKRGVNPEKESWALGCVRGFLDKMNKERDATLRLGSSAAMVLVSNKEQEARDAYTLAHTDPEDKRKKAFRTVRTASKAQSDHDAMSRGYMKGQTITVSPGLGNGNITPPKLGRGN